MLAMATVAVDVRASCKCSVRWHIVRGELRALIARCQWSIWRPRREGMSTRGKTLKLLINLGSGRILRGKLRGNLVTRITCDLPRVTSEPAYSPQRDPARCGTGMSDR